MTTLIEYNNAIKVKPQESEHYYNKGICLCKLGNYENAIEAFNNALKYSDIKGFLRYPSDGKINFIISI